MKNHYITYIIFLLISTKSYIHKTSFTNLVKFFPRSFSISKDLKPAFSKGSIILFILLVSCIASDLGGFIFGKTIKGPKLTKISPNKTYSGAIGSIILTTFVMSILFFYTTGSFNLKTILIAISTSVSCQFGDLIFSFLKRKAKLKDTGNFVPGHGGVLDRLDGIIVGIPVGFWILIILN